MIFAMKLISCLLLSMFFINIVKAEKADRNEQNKKSLAESYYKLAIDFLDSYPDSTLYYGKKQKLIAEEINNANLLANAYDIMGYAYTKKKIFDLSAMYYYKGLDALKGKSDHSSNIRRKDIYSGLGYVYDLTYNYELALQYYLDALEIVRNESGKKQIIMFTYYVGVIYKKKGALEKAKGYYNKAINLESQGENNFYLAKTYNSLGNVFLLQEKFDSAIYYYKKALDISRDVKSLERERIHYLSNIGENFYKQGQYEEAKQRYLIALKLSLNLNDTAKSRLVLNNIGDVLLKQNKYEEAIIYYNQSLKLEGNQKNVSDYELRRASKQIAIAYDAIGEYKLASEYKSKYLAQIEKIEETKDNLQQQNARYRMKEVEWQRQLQEKERKIAGFQTENLWSKIIISIALIIIAIASWKIYDYSKKIAKVKMIIYSDEV